MYIQCRDPAKAALLARSELVLTTLTTSASAQLLQASLEAEPWGLLFSVVCGVERDVLSGKPGRSYV